MRFRPFRRDVTDTSALAYSSVRAGWVDRIVKQETRPPALTNSKWSEGTRRTPERGPLKGDIPMGTTNGQMAAPVAENSSCHSTGQGSSGGVSGRRSLVV